MDLYDVVREAAFDLGSEVNNRDRYEVGSLLRAGHGTGALSLWRSIHELTIVAKLVDDHGDDLARRYLDHEAVSAYNDLLEYNEHADRLDVDPIEDDELKEAKQRSDDAIE